MEESSGSSLAALFGRNLRLERERLGWSQSEVARRMAGAGWRKYSQVAVSRTEDGIRSVRLDEALMLAEVLDVALPVLLRPGDVVDVVRRIEDDIKSLAQAQEAIADQVARLILTKESLMEARSRDVRVEGDQGELEAAQVRAQVAIKGHTVWEALQAGVHGYAFEAYPASEAEAAIEHFGGLAKYTTAQTGVQERDRG